MVDQEMQKKEKRKNEPTDQIAAKKAKWAKNKTPEKTPKSGPGSADQDVKRGNAKNPEKEPLKRKELKRNRKMHENPNFETEMAMKKLWEKLRNAETSEAREEFVRQVFDAIKTSEENLEKVAFAHDTSRVLQSCLQHGSAEQRRFIYTELKAKIPEMAQSKYARNVVLKLIKYGERDIKDHCIENMGNVRKLVRSAIGQSVLEYAFNQFAQSKQRSAIVSKLYGKSWTRLAKTEKEPTLINVINKNADFCETILVDFMEDLKALTEKEIMRQTISHRAFLDFFNLCLYLLNSEDSKIMEKRKRVEEIRSELIEELKASVIHMIHTPDGARTGLHCVWFGSAKDRKLILKTMKEFLVKVVTADSGYLLALGAIDSVDDTVLVRKMLISPILKELDVLMEQKPARKVIWYVLNGRDPKTFLPDVVRLLEVGDESVTCKKPRDVKYAEIKTAAMPHVLEWFSENTAKCFADAGLLPMLVTALNHDDKNYIFKDEENMLSTCHLSIAKKLNMDYTSEDHPLRMKGVQMSIRKILAFDQSRVQYKFSKILAETCEGVLATWLSDNRGCFLLLNLVEANDEETTTIVQNALGDTLVSDRESIMKTAGGKLLMEKLIDNEGNFKTFKATVTETVKMET